MPEDFNPQCVYASAYDETTKETTWSTEGVELDQVRPVEGVVRCKSSHLSRFTANENLIQNPEPIEVIVTKPSEDDKASDAFPIMTGFASLLVLIICAVSLREIRQTNQKHRRTGTAESNLELSRQLKGIPVQDEVDEPSTGRGLNETRKMEDFDVHSEPGKMVGQAEEQAEYTKPSNTIIIRNPDYAIEYLSDLDRYENLFQKIRSPDLDSPSTFPNRGTEGA